LEPARFGSHYFDKEFDSENADEACSYVMCKGVFADLENPVTSAAAVATDSGFELATAIAE
jgi:hypothetical protein